MEYIFKIPGVKAFLSEHLSQDTLEQLFGCPRQRGKSNKTPNMEQLCKGIRHFKLSMALVDLSREVTEQLVKPLDNLEKATIVVDELAKLELTSSQVSRLAKPVKQTDESTEVKQTVIEKQQSRIADID